MKPSRARLVSEGGAHLGVLRAAEFFFEEAAQEPLHDKAEQSLQRSLVQLGIQMRAESFTTRPVKREFGPRCFWREPVQHPRHLVERSEREPEVGVRKQAFTSMPIPSSRSGMRKSSCVSPWRCSMTSSQARLRRPL